MNKQKSKTQKGITLIALIITIVVLLILALVTINAIQGDGIIEYARNARDDYEQAQANEQGMLDNYISKIEGSLNDKEGEVEVTHDTVIPVGAYYYSNDFYVLCPNCQQEEMNIDSIIENYCSNCDGGFLEEFPESQYKVGEKFPTPETGDVYIYGDYQYRYNTEYDIGWNSPASMSEGWGVRVLDTSKDTYGKIIESIANKKITSTTGTFWGCQNLTTIPDIPSTVTRMGFCFAQCTSLTDVSDFVVSKNVEYIGSAFDSCTSLTTAVDLSNAESLEDMSGMYYGCTNLVDGGIIPETVNNLSMTFYNCTSLTGTIRVKRGESGTNFNYSNCFYGTVLPIHLTGPRDFWDARASLAGTANNNNVTFEIPE